MGTALGVLVNRPFAVRARNRRLVGVVIVIAIFDVDVVFVVIIFKVVDHFAPRRLGVCAWVRGTAKLRGIRQGSRYQHYAIAGNRTTRR
jgi:hypothetical protein